MDIELAIESASSGEHPRKRVRMTDYKRHLLAVVIAVAYPRCPKHVRDLVKKSAGFYLGVFFGPDFATASRGGDYDEAVAANLNKKLGVNYPPRSYSTFEAAPWPDPTLLYRKGSRDHGVIATTPALRSLARRSEWVREVKSAMEVIRSSAEEDLRKLAVCEMSPLRLAGVRIELRKVRDARVWSPEPETAPPAEPEPLPDPGPLPEPLPDNVTWRLLEQPLAPCYPYCESLAGACDRMGSEAWLPDTSPYLLIKIP